MYVNCKKTFRFTKSRLLKTKLSDGSEQITHVEDDECVVRPSLIPQQVPDWITKDPLYELAQDDGDIYEAILSKKQQTEIDAKNANPTQAPAPAAPATGWQSTAAKPSGFSAPVK